MKEIKIGTVTHYFAKPSVAAIELSAPIAVGDKVVFKGATTFLEQEISSMQIEHQDIEKAGAGQIVGIKVGSRVRVGDIIYKVED